MPNLSPPSHRGMQYHHFHDTLHRDVVTPGETQPTHWVTLKK